MECDQIYKFKNTIEDFKFDMNVAKVFDDMVKRSVPFYTEIHHYIAKFIKSIIKSDAIIYDLGCSTGNMIDILIDHIENHNTKIVGIDNSESMLEIAKRKKMHKPNVTIEFLNVDVLKYKDYLKTDIFIINLLLQFIRPIYRKGLLEKLYKSLQKGGFLILFEKVLEDDAYFTRNYIDLYYDFKKTNGYSDLEVSKKREELENVLIPYTVEENIELLRNVGFTEISVLFKVINFAVIIAKKD